MSISLKMKEDALYPWARARHYFWNNNNRNKIWVFRGHYFTCIYESFLLMDQTLLCEKMYKLGIKLKLKIFPSKSLREKIPKRSVKFKTETRSQNYSDIKLKIMYVFFNILSFEEIELSNVPNPNVFSSQNFESKKKIHSVFKCRSFMPQLRPWRHLF